MSTFFVGRPPGPEMENCVDRESYTLAAGLALGLVLLERGSDLSGLTDLGIADTLHYYMVGGHKRPLSGNSVSYRLIYFIFLLIRLKRENFIVIF